VNLNVSQIRWSAQENRAKLYLNPDISYVLEHHETYVAPCQTIGGQQVCLAIRGGNTGLGFSNMTDAQIADFVAQVKLVVEKANLDGVNLWDEGAAYGKEGMPAVNTTSYPKLIKALDEAMPGNLITVVDMGDPFDVAQAGITVGDHIDYAWTMDYSAWTADPNDIDLSGYDPWGPDPKRKPILGLEKENYGAISFDVYQLNRFTGNSSDPNAQAWQMGEIPVMKIMEFIDNGGNAKLFVVNDIGIFDQAFGERGGNTFPGNLITYVYDPDWMTWMSQLGSYSSSYYGEVNMWYPDW
jgi:hypothetical protein